MSGDGVDAGDGSEWNRGVDSRPAGDADPPTAGPAADARESTAELPRPPTEWRGTGDPTGSTTWRWLTRATLLSALLLTFWSVPLVLFDVVDRLGLDAVATGAALGMVGMLTGAVFATLACGYYLFKRQRHVGNPRVLQAPEHVYYDGRTVGSNWHLVVASTVALSMTIGGVGSVFTLLEIVSGDLATAFVGPLVLLFVLALLCRLVLLPVAFYRDARAVAESEADWNPNGTLYAVVGYVFALPATALHLYRRHTRTGDLFQG